MADEYIKMATYFEAVRRREKGRVITAADLTAALTSDPEALDVHLARPGCRPNAIEKYDNAGSLGEPNELPETSSFLLVQATIHPPSKTQGTSHAPTSHQKHLINSIRASSLSASSRKLQHVLTHTSLSSGRALEDVRAIFESVWMAGASEGHLHWRTLRVCVS